MIETQTLLVVTQSKVRAWTLSAAFLLNDCHLVVVRCNTESSWPDGPLQGLEIPLGSQLNLVWPPMLSTYTTGSKRVLGTAWWSSGVTLWVPGQWGNIHPAGYRHNFKSALRSPFGVYISISIILSKIDAVLGKIDVTFHDWANASVRRHQRVDWSCHHSFLCRVSTNTAVKLAEQGGFCF